MTAWLSAREAADELGMHPVTVRRLLESGQLHGHKPSSRWRIHPDVPDLWVTGRDTREPCGCARVTPLRRRSA